MKVQSSKFKVQILMLLAIVLSACAFQTKHRGYVFPKTIDDDVAEIKTTSQLMERVGAPQTKTLYGDEVWIYYGADENFRGPLPHTFTDKTVLLAWVRGNTVQRIKILHDDELEKIKIASGETEIPASIELNAIQELFNNIGRFSPAGLGQ